MVPGGNNYNCAMVKYLYNGIRVDHNNLSDFLICQGKNGIIPYNKRDDIDTKKIKKDGDHIVEIFWSISYSGGWGSGYSSFIKYVPNQKNCWIVGFFDDNKEKFIDRGKNYDYGDQGFILKCCNKETAVIASDKLKNIIKYAFYYGLKPSINDDEIVGENQGYLTVNRNTNNNLDEIDFLSDSDDAGVEKV